MEKLLGKITWTISILAGFYIVNAILIFIQFIPFIREIIGIIFSFFGVNYIVSIFVGIVIKKRFFSELEIKNSLGIKNKVTNDNEIL